MAKSCNECVFALFQDYGYSNYTTEGTTFECLKKQHPEDGFDRFYGHDKRLDFAEQCNVFEGGDPVAVDVEREDWPGTEHPEAKAIMEARGKWA